MSDFKQLTDEGEDIEEYNYASRVHCQWKLQRFCRATYGVLPSTIYQIINELHIAKKEPNTRNIKPKIAWPEVGVMLMAVDERISNMTADSRDKSY